MTEHPPGSKKERFDVENISRLVDANIVVGVFKELLKEGAGANGAQGTSEALMRLKQIRFVEAEPGTLSHGFMSVNLGSNPPAILVDSGNIKTRFAEFMEENRDSHLSEEQKREIFQTYIKRSIIHEMTHMSGFLSESHGESVSTLKAGVERIFVRTDPTTGQKVQSNVFTSLNEAITEKLARKVSVEYFHRSGDRAALTHNDPDGRRTIDRASLAEAGNMPMVFEPYALDIEILDTLIEFAAEETGAHKDVVWTSIVQAYQKGPEQLTSSLSDMFFGRKEWNDWFSAYQRNEHPTREQRAELLRELKSLIEGVA